MKYSSKDIELVTNKYYEIKRLLVTSEFLRCKINEYAYSQNTKGEYESKYPYTAIWKINSDCNLRCKHCYFYGSNDYSTENDLSLTEIFQVIDQLSDMGVAEIRLTGGEVFLQKDIFKIIEYIKNKGMAVIITTNGTLINKEIAKKLNKIISPDTDIMRVSIDGASSTTHDSTRGSGVFNKAIKSIKLLKEEGLTVFCSTVVTSKNVQELSELYSLLNNLEVKQMTLIKVIPIDNSQLELVPVFEDLVYYSAKMYDCVKENDFIRIDNRLFKPFDFLQDEISKKCLNKFVTKSKKINPYTHCNADKSFYIDADGTVYLCPLAADYHYSPLGNIKDETMEAIFEKRGNNILFQKRDLSNSSCFSCKIFSLCKGGNCPMQSYMKYKDINVPPCC